VSPLDNVPDEVPGVLQLEAGEASPVLLEDRAGGLGDAVEVMGLVEQGGPDLVVKGRRLGRPTGEELAILGLPEELHGSILRGMVDKRHAVSSPASHRCRCTCGGSCRRSPTASGSVVSESSCQGPSCHALVVESYS